jgi:Tfp pilus assembly protein FimV
MKKFFFGLLVVLISFVVVACGGTPAPAPAPVAEVPPPPPPPSPPRGGIVLDGASNYTVVKGDTLSNIAAGKYGESNRYFFSLIQLGSAAVVKDPDVLEVGDKLVIPELQRNLNDAGACAVIRDAMLATASQYERQRKPNAASILKNLAARISK